MLWCNLFGCRVDDEVLCCRRCFAPLYDEDKGFGPPLMFVQQGKLGPVIDWASSILVRLRQFIFPPRCVVCRKRLPKHRWWIMCCESDDCIDSHLPF